MGNSPSPWRGSTGIPKPFLFPLFSFGPHPPILPEVSDPPWHGERLLASESRCAEQETTFGPDDRKQEGAATDPPPPPQSPQETVLYSRHRVQRPAHSPLPQTVAPWWVFFPFLFVPPSPVVLRDLRINEKRTNMSRLPWCRGKYQTVYLLKKTFQ